MSAYSVIYLALTFLGMLAVPALISVWRVHRSRVTDEARISTLERDHGTTRDHQRWLEERLMTLGLEKLRNDGPGGGNGRGSP